MPPTTIAYVMTHYPRITQTFIANEIHGLVDAGHQVVRIAINPPEGVDAAHPEVADTYYLKNESPLRVGRILAGAAAAHPRAFAAVLARALRTAGTDIGLGAKRLAHFAEAVLIWRRATDAGAGHIHAHFGLTPSTLAMWACEFARIAGEGPQRWSFTYHSGSEMFEPGLALNAAKAASVDAAICVSDATRSQLMRTSDPEHWPKLHVIRCGIDLTRFEHRDPPPVQDPPLITMVGRLAPEKGHLVLLDAMAMLVDRGLPVRLRIIGGGAFESAIAAAVRRAGLDDLVELAGEIAPAEVPAAVEASDVFCLPSFDEGLPVAIMEAMAIGVPVVTTYIAGIPELAVDGDTAMVVPAGNVEALAEAIHAIVTDDSLRSRVAKAARAAVERDHDERHTGPAFRQAILGGS